VHQYDGGGRHERADHDVDGGAQDGEDVGPVGDEERVVGRRQWREQVLRSEDHGGDEVPDRRQGAGGAGREPTGGEGEQGVQHDRDRHRREEPARCDERGVVGVHQRLRAADQQHRLHRDGPGDEHQEERQRAGGARERP